VPHRGSGPVLLPGAAAHWGWSRTRYGPPQDHDDPFRAHDPQETA
jgi:hypothetical protein